jgi:hypothetical protein
MRQFNQQKTSGRSNCFTSEPQHEKPNLPVPDLQVIGGLEAALRNSWLRRRKEMVAENAYLNGARLARFLRICPF